METLETVLDVNGNQVIILPDIIFSGKQNIDWNEVEKYLERFVGELVEIAETGDIIYLGKDFPDEYSGSKYTRKMKYLLMIFLCQNGYRMSLCGITFYTSHSYQYIPERKY